MSKFIHSFILLLMVCLVYVYALPDENLKAPKVHHILQLTTPIEDKGRYTNDDTLKLKCIATGYPAPKIQWSFNGVLFQKGKSLDGTDNTNVRHEISGNTLILRKVRGRDDATQENHDTGRYRCIATNVVGSVFVEKYINIRVMGRFAASNTEQKSATFWNPVVGKPYFIECPKHTKGYGTQYRWGYFKRGESKPVFFYEPGYPNERVFPDYSNGRLWWSVVTVDDVRENRNIGGLRCFLVNGNKFTSSNTQLFYQIAGVVDYKQKPVIKAHLQPIMYATVNKEISLICGAVGNPVPMISWQYRGVDVKPRNGSSYELNFEFFQLKGLRNQELRIRRVTKESGGSFKCFASNKMGTVWSEGQLTVQYSPQWINTFPDAIEVTLGNHFELVCNATGSPKPKYTWYRNGVSVINDIDGRKTVTRGSTGSVLLIKKIKKEDNGIYICEAKNSVYTIAQSVHIQIGRLDEELKKSDEYQVDKQQDGEY